MLFLIRRLRTSGRDLSDPRLRRKYGSLSGLVGIGLNILLFIGKLLAGVFSGSVAIMADAFNNLADAGSSIVTIVGFKLSGKKPDPQHPFGHGRFEYVTGFVVSVLIILMGFELALGSIRSLKSPEPTTFSTMAVVILSVSIAVKLYMAIYNILLSKLLASSALKATALDSISDTAATFGVLVSLLISHYTQVQLDSYAGLLVSAFIFYSGIMSARDTLQPLLGVPPEKEFVEKIEEIVNNHPPIVGMHDLVVHDYGPGRVMISLHAEIPSNIEVFTAHCIIDDLETLLTEKLGCEAVIHFDPIDLDDKELARLKAVVSEVVSGIDEKLSIHDFRYVPGQTHTNLVFDIVIPYNYRERDETLIKQIQELVAQRLPDHNCVIKCDKPRI